MLYHRSDVPLFCRLCVFQHALRLLAFGQLYKVLNMDPLPASKPSPRLLEGACRLVCALFCKFIRFPVFTFFKFIFEPSVQIQSWQH